MLVCIKRHKKEPKKTKYEVGACMICSKYKKEGGRPLMSTLSVGLRASERKGLCYAFIIDFVSVRGELVVQNLTFSVKVLEKHTVH